MGLTMTIESHKMNAAAARKFVYAGNAIVTVKSTKTGERFTLRFARAKVRGCSCENVEGAEDCAACQRDTAEPTWFAKVMTGSDNEAEKSYSYVGFVKGAAGADRHFIYGGAKAKVGRDTPSVKAVEWLVTAMATLDAVLADGPAAEDAGDRLAGALARLGQVELWHEGVCGRCAHRLTVPESIESGLGPVCMTRGEL